MLCQYSAPVITVTEDWEVFIVKECKFLHACRKGGGEVNGMDERRALRVRRRMTLLLAQAILLNNLT